MKSKEWKIPYCKPYVSPELRRSGRGPLLNAVLALKGIKTEAEARRLLDGGRVFYNPLLMKGMPEAVKRLRLGIERGEKMAVYGDYDVDGITSTCLVTDYLRSKGISCIPYIPDRSDEGYGINCEAVKHLHALGVSLLISVDCGITATEETEYARSLGMDMVITDHHECKSGCLPNAAAVIDCKQDGDEYPNKELAGVGVALKLCCACEGSSGPVLSAYSDLAAVGTIADVMPLTGENRFLVKLGLKKLMDAPRPGFSALMKEAGVDMENINAATVGFSLAPRLNAAGRLCQADVAGQLLMCKTEAEAAPLAERLCRMNKERQNIETEIWQDAQAMLEGKVPESPIVLASESWHQGVIGIAASRLSEQYSLPAIMVCLTGEQGKGSCRSCGTFNLFEALSACSEHLESFGGHALAAGLTIEKKKLNDFREALADYYKTHRPEALPEVSCDLLIAEPELLSIENVRELDKLEPYGSGNPRPCMCMSGVLMDSCSDVGGGKHLKLRVRLKDSCFDGIYFSHTFEELGLRMGDRVDVAFCPQINEFRGRTSVQLLVSALRKHEPRELCRGILERNSNYLWGASPFCPERVDFVRVWRGMSGAFRVKNGLSGLISQCPRGMDEEKFCICLMTFLETGLLKSPDGSIFGARRANIEGKADLEGSNTIRSLRAV